MCVTTEITGDKGGRENLADILKRDGYPMKMKRTG